MKKFIACFVLENGTYVEVPVKQINENYQTDALTDFLEEISKNLKFHYWLFGHYHNNLNIGNNFVLLYEQIVQAI